jgi:RND family efflux transporter MFP subunit
MVSIIHWAGRHWLVLTIVAALTMVGGAGYLGYTSSQAEQVKPIEAPPTVGVDRGEVLLSVTAPGQFTNAGQASVLSDVNGSLDEVLVQPGETVNAGEVLARIGNRVDFEATVSNAEADVTQAQATLDAINPEALLSQAHVDLLKAQNDYEMARNKRLGLNYGRASQATLDIARSNYILAQADLAQAQDIYGGALALADDDPVRAQAMGQIALATQKRDTALANLNWLLSKPDASEVAQADAEVELAKAKLDSAQAKYDRMQKGEFPERDQAEADLKKAQAALDKAKANLDALEVRAPFAGTVVDVKVNNGQTVTPGLELFKMIDPHKLEVAATVVEEDLQLVRTGQEADLFFDALPDVNVTGHLARIVLQRTNDDHVLYPIYITLDAVPDKLAPGMTVDASIVIEKKEDVLRLPRTVVHARADGTAELSVWNGTQVVKRMVEVGLRGDSYVEIVSGLEEGDQVVSK